eukprot:509790_1
MAQLKDGFDEDWSQKDWLCENWVCEDWFWEGKDRNCRRLAKDINSQIVKAAVGSTSHYKIGKWSYKFYKISTMIGIQMNEKTLRSRMIWCIFKTPNWSNDAVNLNDCLKKNFIEFSELWKNKTNTLQLHALDINGHLFNDIANLFYRYPDKSQFKYKHNLSALRVLKIESVQNPFLWKSYEGMRTAHASIIGESNLNEMYLWHGTDANAVQSICSSGFSRDYGNTMKYGNGVYFAKHALFSKRYAKTDSNGLRQMILARVLLGESCEGEESYNVPPLKFNSSVPFESMVNDLNNPEIFVISKDHQVYPEFVVTFKFI